MKSIYYRVIEKIIATALWLAVPYLAIFGVVQVEQNEFVATTVNLLVPIVIGGLALGFEYLQVRWGFRLYKLIEAAYLADPTRETLEEVAQRTLKK
jgi:hypothetical protein